MFFFYPEFFVKHGVAVMTVRELFDFITDPSITCHNMDQYLEKVRTLPIHSNFIKNSNSHFTKHTDE